MGANKARLVGGLAELLWAAALVLLCMATFEQHDSGLFAIWGVVTAIAAATATGAAIVMCAATKVLAAINRKGIADEVDIYLRKTQM